MSRVETNTFIQKNIGLGWLENYSAHMDYSSNDFLLKMVWEKGVQSQMTFLKKAYDQFKSSGKKTEVDCWVIDPVEQGGCCVYFRYDPILEVNYENRTYGYLLPGISNVNKDLALAALETLECYDFHREGIVPQFAEGDFKNYLGKKYGLVDFLDSVRAVASDEVISIQSHSATSKQDEDETDAVAIVDGIEDADGSQHLFESISDIFEYTHEGETEPVPVKGLVSYESGDTIQQPKTITLLRDAVQMDEHGEITVEKIILGTTDTLPPNMETLRVIHNGYLLKVELDPELMESYDLTLMVIGGVTIYQVQRKGYEPGYEPTDIIYFWINGEWVPHHWVGPELPREAGEPITDEQVVKIEAEQREKAISTPVHRSSNHVKTARADSEWSTEPYRPEEKLQSFLDLMLVKTSDFLVRYIEWLALLRKIERNVNDMESYHSLGIPAKVHDGLLIFSGDADTEAKIKEQFGGEKWRRIVNFPMLIRDADKDKLKTRGGESFVSLISDNIPNHGHGLTLDKANQKTGDKWKTGKVPGGSDPKNNFVTGSNPGLVLGSKLVYPEVAPLNWSSDLDQKSKQSNGYCTKGSARYVKPHFNIPPYKDVYIWECVQAKPAIKKDAVQIHIPEELPPAKRVPLEQTWEYLEKMDEMATRGNALLSFKDIPGDSRALTDWNIPDLEHWGGLDYLCTLVSDELLGEEQIRYDSKDVNLQQMRTLCSWYVWCDKYHVERRYLFRDAYRYLISDIQDRIYNLLKRIYKTKQEIYKERLYLGQYVFFYQPVFSDIKSDEWLKNYYVLPPNTKAEPVSGVFLRGTTMFTKEKMGMFNTYCSATNKDTIYKSIRPEGGLADVDLYADNFPKHLHWSSLVSGVNSANVYKPSSSSKTGGSGSVITCNDPRSGGTKYCNVCGTGPYAFQTKEAGVDTKIAHHNISNMVLMKVYMVVKGASNEK